MLPGIRVPDAWLHEGFRDLCARGFSFRIQAPPREDQLPVGIELSEEYRRLARHDETLLWVCYGAEDVVARLVMGHYSAQGLRDVVRILCAGHVLEGRYGI
jgi:hypothetical protein